MTGPQAGPCDVCGIPIDAQYFDRSGFVRNDDASAPIVPLGERAVLASFRMHPQYCGVIQCFSQYTDLFAADNTQVLTPGLEWMILRDGQPTAPYERLESIVNPWGYGSYSFGIRIDEGALVELAVHNRGFAPENECDQIRVLGGRIMGRFWYNPAFGHPVSNKSA